MFTCDLIKIYIKEFPKLVKEWQNEEIKGLV